jgi:YHS domain-containing protein
MLHDADEVQPKQKITPQEQRMLAEYRGAMYIACSERWPNLFRKAQAENPWRRLPDTKRLGADTRSLMLTLATDPLLADIESGMALPMHGRSGWASRLWPNQRWMLPSPFYGPGFATRRMLFRKTAKHDRREWLTRRHPLVTVYTLHHAEFVATDETPYAVVKKTLERARDRWREVLPAVYAGVGLGGIVSWDITPRIRQRSEPTLQVHLHALVEGYLVKGRRLRGAERPIQILKDGWAESAMAGESRAVTHGRVGVSADQAIPQIKYVAGFTKIGSRLYPKFMRGFDQGPRKRPASGSSRNAEKPTPDQLRLIHTAYLVPPIFSPRWFGLWDFRRRAIRDIDDRSRRELLVNSERAKPLLGV